MKTEYKKVLVGTRAYRRIMSMVGACIEKGGYVDYYHTQVIKTNAFGRIDTKNTVDVTLHWQ